MAGVMWARQLRQPFGFRGTSGGGAAAQSRPPDETRGRRVQEEVKHTVVYTEVH